MIKSQELLSQIIEVSEVYDEELKKARVTTKASTTIGESWMTYHLKILKDLLEQESNET